MRIVWRGALLCLLNELGRLILYWLAMALRCIAGEEQKSDSGLALGARNLSLRAAPYHTMLYYFGVLWRRKICIFDIYSLRYRPQEHKGDM